MSLSIANNIKRVNITSKRQLTIPQAFYSILGFSKEADCILKDDSLIIKPVNTGDNDIISEQILEDLISKGYNGKELLDKFKYMRAQIRPAVENMLKEAHLAAEGKTEFYTIEDVFGNN